jgi:hypothetical protein
MTRTTIEGNILPFKVIGAHTQNGSLSTVVSITVPAGASQMMLQTHTQNVRFTLDGTAATTTLGFLLVADAAPIIISVSPSQLVRVIEVTTTAVLDYQFGA